MPFDAVIFDLDGTLLETERLIVTAGLTAFRRMGLPERLDLLTSMVGSVGDSGEAAMRAAFGAAFDPVVFESHWQEAVTHPLPRAYPSALGDRPSGPSGHDRHAARRGDELAHDGGTQAPRRSGILHHFDPAHIHGRDRVAHPKPAPDLFLHAARGLGADPARCLVFEDSDPGAAGALAAGMTVVLVPDQRAPGPVPVHHIADSLLAGARAAGLLV